WGVGEVIDLVAVANAPAGVAGPVRAALAGGEASWRLVRRFYRSCAALDHEDTAAIATGLFGTDPTAAVTERLDSAGEWLGGPWRHKEFYRALDREVAQHASDDRDKNRQAAAAAAADVGVLIDQLGTAAVTIGCSPVQGAAIADRVERAARAARKAGDPRTLRQLRAAVAVSLLLHGTLSCDLPEDPNLVSVEQSAQLTKILHGMPTAELDVIVPLTTLLGRPGTAPGGDRTTCTCQCSCAAGRSGSSPLGSAVTGEVFPDAEPADPIDMEHPGGSPPRLGVGEVIGRHSLFLTPPEVRALAFTPGSTPS